MTDHDTSRRDTRSRKYRDGHCPECGMVEHRPGCHEAAQANHDNTVATQLAHYLDRRAQELYAQTLCTRYLALVREDIYACTQRHWVRKGMTHGPIVILTGAGPVEVRGTPGYKFGADAPIQLFRLAESDAKLPAPTAELERLRRQVREVEDTIAEFGDDPAAVASILGERMQHWMDA